MAMRFSQAGRAETPDLVGATAEQAQIAAALRQAQQQRQQGNLAAAATFGKMAPEGSWQTLGNAMMGKNAQAPIFDSPGLAGYAAGDAGAAAGADAALAAGAEAAAGDAALAAGTDAALAAGTEAAAGAVAPEVLATTTGGAGLAGGATGGMSGALAGLGPWGWAALAALAMAGANR